MEYPNHVYVLDLYAKQKALEEGKSHIGYTALDLKNVAEDGELTLSLAGPVEYTLRFDDSNGPAGDIHNGNAGRWATIASSSLSYMNSDSKNENIEAVEGLTLGCHRNEGSYVIRDSGQYIISYYDNANPAAPVWSAIQVEPNKRAKAIFHLYETSAWAYGAGYSNNLSTGDALQIGMGDYPVKLNGDMVDENGDPLYSSSTYTGSIAENDTAIQTFSERCAARVCLLPNVWPDQPRTVKRFNPSTPGNTPQQFGFRQAYIDQVIHLSLIHI